MHRNLVLNCDDDATKLSARYSSMNRVIPRLSSIASNLKPSASSLSPRTYATMTDTSKWKFNHTMLRVKDPQKSVDYYKLLGLSLINKMENKDANFDLYFLGK